MDAKIVIAYGLAAKAVAPYRTKTNERGTLKP